MKITLLKELFDTCLRVQSELNKPVFFDFVGHVPLCRVRVSQSTEHPYNYKINKTVHDIKEVKELIDELKKIL